MASSPTPSINTPSAWACKLRGFQLKIGFKPEHTDSFYSKFQKFSQYRSRVPISSPVLNGTRPKVSCIQIQYAIFLIFKNTGTKQNNSALWYSWVRSEKGWIHNANALANSLRTKWRWSRVRCEPYCTWWWGTCRVCTQRNQLKCRLVFSLFWQLQGKQNKPGRWTEKTQNHRFVSVWSGYWRLRWWVNSNKIQLYQSTSLRNLKF